MNQWAAAEPKASGGRVLHGPATIARVLLVLGLHLAVEPDTAEAAQRKSVWSSSQNAGAIPTAAWWVARHWRNAVPLIARLMRDTTAVPTLGGSIWFAASVGRGGRSGEEGGSHWPQACDEAWRILEANTSYISPAEALKIHRQMKSRVMAAVADGERNPEELTIIALNLRQAWS
jgi:hypothetical protein